MKIILMRGYHQIHCLLVKLFDFERTTGFPPTDVRTTPEGDFDWFRRGTATSPMSRGAPRLTVFRLLLHGV
jgi:hypothetical protein